MERLVIAYTLIGLMVLAVAALAAYAVYNGRDRAYRRRLSRERKAHAQRLKETLE
jgi:hypothetical protein